MRVALCVSRKRRSANAQVAQLREPAELARHAAREEVGVQVAAARARTREPTANGASFAGPATVRSIRCRTHSVCSCVRLPSAAGRTPTSRLFGSELRREHAAARESEAARGGGGGGAMVVRVAGSRHGYAQPAPVQHSRRTRRPARRRRCSARQKMCTHLARRRSLQRPIRCGWPSPGRLWTRTARPARRRPRRRHPAAVARTRTLPLRAKRARQPARRPTVAAGRLPSARSRGLTRGSTLRTPGRAAAPHSALLVSRTRSGPTQQVRGACSRAPLRRVTGAAPASAPRAPACLRARR
jgi:hypothetical protein